MKELFVPHTPFPCLRQLLLAALLLFAVASPAAPGLVATENITGAWISSEQIPEQGDVDTLMAINADGSFSGSLLVNNETVWTFAGKWRLEGNAINWEYIDSSLVLLIEDYSEVDTILSLEQDQMTLKSGRWGSVRTLLRVK
jgi:beta-glucanase (GH16 family)